MIEAAQGSRLAALCPADTDEAVAFTATLATEVTRLYVTNLSNGALTFRIWHVEADDAGLVSNEYALFYDKALPAHDTFELFADAPNSGIQLKEGDEIWVQSSSADEIAFNLYGVTASIAPGAGT